MKSALICLAVVAVANVGRASIQLPETLEFSVSGVLHATNGSQSTSPQSRSCQDSSPSAPVSQDELRLLAIIAYTGSLGAGSTGSMAGGSPSSSGSNSGDLAVVPSSDFYAADALVGWLNQSRWLDIPLPPGVSLLRPPQIV